MASNIALNCELCHSASPDGFCECGSRRIFLCSRCISTHFAKPGSHSFKPLGSSDRPLASVSASVGINENCSICQSSVAESICCCQREYISLCQACIPIHHSKWPGEIHTFVPIKAKQFFDNPGYLERLRTRKLGLTRKKAALHDNLTRITTCIEELQEKSSLVINSIQTLRDQKLSELSTAREGMVALFARAEKEADENIYDERYKPQESLASILLGENDPGLSDLFFDYTIVYHPEVIPESFNVFLDLAQQTPSEVVNLKVPWVTQEGLKMFNCASNTWSELRPLDGRTSLDENSSVITLPDGNLLACGSTSASNDVFNINPRSLSVSRMPSMIVRRTGHGMLLWKKSVYVFGGYNLKSCESLPSDRVRWEPLPDMTEIRRFFNPCGLRNKIYICGGNTKTVESFNVVTKTFKPEPLLELPLRADTYSFIHSEQLIIFQSDRIVKWTVDSTTRPVILRLKLIDNGCGLSRYCFSNVNSLAVDGKVYIAMYYKKVLVSINVDNFQVEKIRLT